MGAGRETREYTFGAVVDDACSNVNRIVVANLERYDLGHYEVISPAGIDIVERKAAAPRLADLKGKTIGEIWNGVFKGDETFPILRRALERKFPDVRIVPFTEFPHFPGDDRPASQRAAAQKIAALAKEKGCDAVISGNGA